MNTGLIRGEPIAQYHSADAVGHSKLEVFRDSDRGPARFHGQYIAKTIPPRESTDAMDMGNALDALVLEKKTIFAELPSTYVDDKGAEKKFTMASNACKAMVAAIEAQSLIPLKRDEVFLVNRMRDAVFANQTAAHLLRDGEAQVTMRHRLGQFVVQVRPDWWQPDGCTLTHNEPYMCDLKSAEDFDQFLSNRRAFGYDRQAALYREVSRLVLSTVTGTPIVEIAAPEFFFIVVFKTPPVQAVVFRPGAEDMRAATDESTDDLIRLKRCFEKNEWPGVPSGIVELPKIWRKAA